MTQITCLSEKQNLLFLTLFIYAGQILSFAVLYFPISGNIPIRPGRPRQYEVQVKVPNTVLGSEFLKIR